MLIDPKLFRSSFLGRKLRIEMSKKGITEKEIEKNGGGNQSNVNKILNGKIVASDKTFEKIGKAIGLTTKEIKDIFKQADIEEFIYKYDDKIPNDKKMSIKEALEFIKSNANLSQAEKLVLQEIESKN